MDGSLVLLAATLGLLGFGLVEKRLHAHRLRQLKWRVHVNGTRGKSSVTRLIAAGLRAGNHPTCAKTTGTKPRWILPDGSEQEIIRPGRPNVREQMPVVELALQAKADVLVAECMALHPALQTLCERHLLEATHAVITNVRADHLEVMGPGESDVARALCGMIPPGGKLYTAEERYLRLIRRCAADRGATLIPVTAADVQQISCEELAQFAYVEHAENVALALRVCQDFGVSRDVALAGMWSATPDPGVMTVELWREAGKELTFYNALAANDPHSTEYLWRLALARTPVGRPRILLMNCRADRPERSQQLGRAIASWPTPDLCVVMGSGTALFAQAAQEAGVARSVLVGAEDWKPADITAKLLAVAGPAAVVVGMGNIGGEGPLWLEQARRQFARKACSNWPPLNCVQKRAPIGAESV